ncbi:hypothetical protein P152DRAFT_329927 [Eremomyces bilateralis CBS 781.70]|uniref:Protein FAM118B n=1 Tax=Eremomyces bilateralis CBS 781.70 TaxID=1392243 RepID=A0A6G1G4P4_9PEZI|nr:uncharacterized protein P152DRAFT_329927 [Eremomyces bilateralis CBS 781.70]KAF1812886.1 hypothetical protein P152DRAFT_329927 [Eremomyces bilateralis CBS 781.70]
MVSQYSPTMPKRESETQTHQVAEKRRKIVDDNDGTQLATTPPQQHATSPLTTTIELIRLDRIRDALNNKRLVIMVGAGVTLNATATRSGDMLGELSWKGLIQNGLNYLVADGHVEEDHRSLRFARDILQDSKSQPKELLQAAGILKDFLEDAGHLPTWLHDTFSGLSEQVRHADILNVLKSFHDKGAQLLTTNYDDLLEEGHCNLPRIRRTNHEELLKFQNRDIRGVVHVHGSFHDPTDVILDTTDYYKIKTSDDVQKLLKTLWNTCTILFVGCGSGLEDPNFSALLKWACEHQNNILNRHCLLVRTGDPLNVKPLVRLQFGTSYTDLVPYLQRLLEDPEQSAAGGSTRPNRK